VGTLGRKIPLQGKTSFIFRVRRREDYFSPKGKVFSPCGFALPKKVTLLRALRALRASLVISFRARGRGESVWHKRFSKARDYYCYLQNPFSRRLCVPPPLRPTATEEAPLLDRAPERSPLREDRLVHFLLMLSPSRAGPAGTIPQRWSPRRKARTGKSP
jgi:hypothetical protein